MSSAHANPNQSTTISQQHHRQSGEGQSFPLWREFLWGGLAGAFGEGIMHPVDTTKTRMQSAVLIQGSQPSKGIGQMVKAIWISDGLKGFYRGVTPGLTGSLATGATYFGVIESTKTWIERKHPTIQGHWAHFLAGAIGDTVGSFIYVPCEVMKQRMQVQGTKGSWCAVATKDGSMLKPSTSMYEYYSGIFQAGASILRHEGLKGLYEGYWSTLARDVPFAGLMIMFYEALKEAVEHSKRRWAVSSNWQDQTSIEGLLLGGVAGGISAYMTTPLDVIKTRLQVQGSVKRKVQEQSLRKGKLGKKVEGGFPMASNSSTINNKTNSNNLIRGNSGSYNNNSSTDSNIRNKGINISNNSNNISASK